MRNKSKNSHEQMFQVGRSLARNIMESSDEDILNDNPEQLIAGKTTGELIYERALNTTEQGAVEQGAVNSNSEFSTKDFNLSNFMLVGLNASAARYKLKTLSAANDPSLQLVASQVNELTDADVIRIYNELLADGVFKT